MKNKIISFLIKLLSKNKIIFLSDFDKELAKLTPKGKYYSIWIDKIVHSNETITMSFKCSIGGPFFTGPTPNEAIKLLKQSLKKAVTSPVEEIVIDA